MSGAFSTAKPACSTLPLCSWPTLPIWPSTSPPSLRLSLICAVVLMSSIARMHGRVLAPATLTPPTRSAAFSLSAIQRAAAARGAALAEREHRGAARLGVMKASAWIETNRSACTRRAFARARAAARRSRRRGSASRACSGCALMRSRSCSAIASTTSFSRRPLGPMAPGSSPPWPGSSATMIRRSIFAARHRRRDRRRRRRHRRRGGAGGAAAVVRRRRPRRRRVRSRPMNSPSASWTACAACALGLLLVADQRQQRVALLRSDRGRRPAGAGRPPPARA